MRKAEIQVIGCKYPQSTAYMSKLRRKRRFMDLVTMVLTLLMVLIPVALSIADNRISITVEQIYTPSTGPQRAVFTYKLYPVEASNPMPSGGDSEGYSFKITGTGNALIGPISYDRSGIYGYILYQVFDAKNTNYVHDKQV